VLAHLGADLSVPALCQRAAMSERNFARVFRAATGVTPAGFVEVARIDEARRLVEASDVPLKKLADTLGYGNVDGFRRAFTRRLGVSPNDYRKRFTGQHAA
jgi:transcriptional regulator GlxA family with amidase domain